MWPFCTTLSATLFSIFSTLKPGVVLFSIMNPGIAVAFCGCKKSARCAGTDERLGQSETADLVEPRHWREPLLFLFFRPIYIYRAHTQSVVPPDEGRERRVDTCDLHLDEA